MSFVIFLALKVDRPDIENDLYGQTTYKEKKKKKRKYMKTRRQTPDSNINTILRGLNSAPLSPPLSQSKPTIAKSKFASTKNMKELVIGRCYEYMFKSNQSSSRWDCGMLWSKLFEAFSYKGPCEVTQHDYENLIDLMEENIPKDKVCITSVYHHF